MPALITDTRRSLAGLASPDEFETLATAVLRAAEPHDAALIHTGTNLDGRAVKSPVDGIGFSVIRGSRRLLMVQHTITARRELRRKWLDPENGDLIKAAAILSEEQQRSPTQQATVVLASSVDPDEVLIRDVHAAAILGMTVDLWPGSRIADFLDRNPEGQWLRRQQFGTAATRLSPTAAREISRLSLDAYLPLVERGDVVSRRLDADLERFATGGRDGAAASRRSDCCARRSPSSGSAASSAYWKDWIRQSRRRAPTRSRTAATTCAVDRSANPRQPLEGGNSRRSGGGPIPEGHC